LENSSRPQLSNFANCPVAAPVKELEPSVKLLVELLYGFRARLPFRLGLAVIRRQPLLAFPAVEK
jgi:hypothetical protein